MFQILYKCSTDNIRFNYSFFLLFSYKQNNRTLAEEEEREEKETTGEFLNTYRSNGRRKRTDTVAYPKKVKAF